MPHKKLEHYRLFPVVAWTVTLLFAGFVVHIAVRINSTANELEATSQNLGEQMRSVEEMFERKNSGDAE